MRTSEEFIAHVRKTDKSKRQTLKDHLEGVASLSSEFASKTGLALAGELLGLLHDLGKYSKEFQNYLKSATELLNPDEDEEFVDAKGLKGKIDHSTAGAQLVWKELSNQGDLGIVVGQILALCIASHHSGLIDCLSSDSSNPVADNFSRRMGKPDEKTHLKEAMAKADSVVLERFRTILHDATLMRCLEEAIRKISRNAPGRNIKGFHTRKSVVAQFQIGLLVRLLFSFLIDADRINSADFENPNAAKHRLHGRYTGWGGLVGRLESHLSNFAGDNSIDVIRKDISKHCLDASARSKGVYTLTVPTGGGKTLASLRFALHHAKIHALDRIFYVIPFTSIVDQNADVARKILEPEEYPEDKGRIVLEHHSNLDPETQGWRDKLLAENWDAPVVFTTTLQLLEALFGAGTRDARRMHQLANSVIVFDEIQTLPIKCVHLFNNAVNFLAEQCGSTIVLCTATQPLLDEVCEMKGSIRITSGGEIMPDVRGLFEKLKRVEIKDKRKNGGWTEGEIADLAVNESGRVGSCLVVVNTKKAARNLYRKIEGQSSIPLFHLSTSMCPIHRREQLKKIRDNLDPKRNTPIVCISTQLIEAGVDVDFGSVIRFAAGLDSIAQAAGRCNRNGKRDTGIVHVVDPTDENLGNLDDICIGLEKAKRVLNDFRENPSKYGNNLLGKEAMDWYYRNYFHERKKEMDYPVSAKQIGRDDTILNLLSINSMAVGNFRWPPGMPRPYLCQSFMAAAKAFKVIDAPTQGIIVQYGTAGKELVAELCAAYELGKQFKILRQAQQYTVNVFPHEFRKLLDEGAAREVQEDTGIYYLNERYYSKDFGLSTEPVSDQEFLHVG
ncbi:MAG TPA: CRISPR-associated helicase Cas3' [Fibrobacteria bacterium]|nr:CRISPR-associated helicase Cas3' [Fibrobacteria bacterium]